MSYNDIMSAGDSAKLGKTKHTFIVEHLDPELEEWQRLEYSTIAQECQVAQSTFILSGRPEALSEDQALAKINATAKTVEQLLQEADLPKTQACLLDPKGEKDLSPEDGDTFSVFVFGGILGDDPPRDRTAELRAKGYVGRRLGPEQMTTDTAARVTRKVVLEKIPLNQIQYVDRPDLEIAQGESVSMPFKYVADKNGKPILPEGMMELLAQDADKDILDLL